MVVINKQTIQDMIAYDAATWADIKKIKLQTGLWSAVNREYLIEPMQSEAPKICYMKATGGGFSETEILKSIHGMIYGKYPQGVLYMFPTNNDVSDFSKSRFNPLIAANKEAIGKYIKSAGKGTDSTTLKKVGSSFLYLRGARLVPSDEGAGAKESTKLMGIQVDRFVADETDPMDSDAIAKARGRMGSAAVDGVKGRTEEVYVANPSDEDRGIHIFWQKSDQRYWWNQCACGAWTCAIKSFPDCVKLKSDGTGYIACDKCGKEIENRTKGRWIADFPSIKDLVGYHWSHLNSAYHDPARILRDYTNPPEGNLGDVYRLDLGLPYSAREDKLRKSDVLANCSYDLMPESFVGPCAMGVDIGKTKHVVIGIRTGNDRYEILKIVQVQTFNQIHDLARRYGVKSAVIDIRPYEDEARNFQKQENYKIFLCEYTDSPLQEADFNDNNGIVKTYRTGILDQTHRLMLNGQIKLPRQNPVVEEFTRQYCNTAKSKETNKKTGQIIYRYNQTGTGEDHYRHATGYFVLAAHRCRTTSAKSVYNERSHQKFAKHETVKL